MSATEWRYPVRILPMRQNALTRQGLFSTIKIKVAKMAGDKVWLEFALKPQPRISAINYYGASKGEKKDLEERLQLMKGNQITQNIVNRATQIIKRLLQSEGLRQRRGSYRPD